MSDPAGSRFRQAHPENAAVITGRENRWLKRFRTALSGEHGDESGIVGVEGVRLVEAALGSGLAIEALLISESGERHLARIAPVLGSTVPVLRTTDKLFAGVSDTQAPQGIAALVTPRQATVEDLLRGIALVVVLAGVQDPGNVGTIVRAAEAFGATGAAICVAQNIGTTDPFGPKALRASAGSALRLPIVSGIEPALLLVRLQKARVKVYAAVAADSTWVASDSKAGVSDGKFSSLLPWDIDWKIPAAILIGNEGAGLPDVLVRAADARVSIPQASSRAVVGIESLNAAMAASVLLYEAMRQRKSAGRARA